MPSPKTALLGTFSVVAISVTIVIALTSGAPAPTVQTPGPVVGGREVELLAGACEIPAIDGRPPAGCQATVEGTPREITAPVGRLPLAFPAAVLSLTVASGPVPDAIELIPVAPGRWELAFENAPTGAYRVLLTTDVAQVAEFILNVTPLTAPDTRGQSETQTTETP